jgi:hypothetical protein
VLAMQLHNGDTLELRDARQRLVGHFTVERSEGCLVFGNFVPGPAFADVEGLFRSFEEAANAPALHAVDDLDRAIAALGLHLQTDVGSGRTEVHDVQIWTDGGMSCRLGAGTPPAANGLAGAATQPQTERSA